MDGAELDAGVDDLVAGGAGIGVAGGFVVEAVFFVELPRGEGMLA